MGYLSMKMVILMKVNIKKILCMEKEFLNGKMVVNMRDNL